MKKFSFILLYLSCFMIAAAWAVDNNQGSNIQLQLQRLAQAQADANNSNAQDATVGTPPTSKNAPSITAPSSSTNAATPASSTSTSSKVKKRTTSSKSSGDKTSQASSDLSSVNDQAFIGMTNSVLPLSPEQIKTLRALFNASQKAASTYPGISPRPTSSDVIVNLAPGATPPVVRLRAGYVTSLVFVDSTGAPWPIKAYDIGDPKAFNVVWDKKSNVLLVQSLSEYRNGNLATLLKGSDTPVMVTLMPGQHAVDYRVELRVPGLGPNAEPMTGSLPSPASDLLLDVLNGIPPRGSKTVNIEGCGLLECQAWALGNKLYLRTMWTLLSPGWIAVMSSPAGVHAYELQSTPVLLVSKHGAMQKLIVGDV